MTDSGGNQIGVSDRFAAFSRDLRPAGLRPGVGSGLTLILAEVGSQVWTPVDLEAIDHEAMTVRHSGKLNTAAEFVVQCSGAEIGEVAFRMRMAEVTEIDPSPLLRLRLVPTALSDLDD